LSPRNLVFDMQKRQLSERIVKSFLGYVSDVGLAPGASPARSGGGARRPPAAPRRRGLPGARDGQRPSASAILGRRRRPLEGGSEKGDPRRRSLARKWLRRNFEAVCRRIPLFGSLLGAGDLGAALQRESGVDEAAEEGMRSDIFRHLLRRCTRKRILRPFRRAVFSTLEVDPNASVWT